MTAISLVVAFVALAVAIANVLFNRRGANEARRQSNAMEKQIDAVERQMEMMERQVTVMEAEYERSARGALSCDVLGQGLADGVWTFQVRVSNLRGAARHTVLWFHATDGVTSDRVQLGAFASDTIRHVEISVPAALWGAGSGWRACLEWTDTDDELQTATSKASIDVASNVPALNFETPFDPSAKDESVPWIPDLATGTIHFGTVGGSHSDMIVANADLRGLPRGRIFDGVAQGYGEAAGWVGLAQSEYQRRFPDDSYA
jgi:hypothetical protein